MNQSAYFDIGDIFINELVGDINLFIILSLALLWWLAIKNKMPYQAPLLLSILWLSGIFIYNTGLEVIWVFVVLFVGAIFYYQISKILRRG